MLLQEFDKNNKAVLDPLELYKPIKNFPKIAVSCFSSATFNRMRSDLKADEIIAEISFANLKINVYKATYKNVSIALYTSYVGAAGCVSMTENIFAFGAEKIVLFGNCGVLDKTIEDCGIIIPTSALRDEGTSFHYASESNEIIVNPKYIENFKQILSDAGINYRTGKTWTTDGFWRETRDKVQRRKEAGAICVEMECSAMAALAQFRHKDIFQFFYAGDNLDAPKWEARSIDSATNLEVKDTVAKLALELAADIA